MAPRKATAKASVCRAKISPGPGQRAKMPPELLLTRIFEDILTNKGLELRTVQFSKNIALPLEYCESLMLGSVLMFKDVRFFPNAWRRVLV